MTKKNELIEMATDVLQKHIGTFQFQLLVDGKYDAIIDAMLEYTEKRLSLLGVSESFSKSDLLDLGGWFDGSPEFVEEVVSDWLNAR